MRPNSEKKNHEKNLGQENAEDKVNSLSQDMNIRDIVEPELISNTLIPEVDEDWGNKLWEAVKTTHGEKGSKYAKPPIKELDFDKKTLRARDEVKVWGSCIKNLARE